MTKYIISQQNRINTMDDVNMLFYIRKGSEDDENADNFTVLKKFNNFAQLTNDVNIYNVVTAVSYVDIGSNMPDKIDFSKNELDESKIGMVYGVVYNKITSNVFYVEVAFCKDMEAAQELFTKRLDGYENIDKKSVTIFEFGKLLNTEANDKFIYSRRRLIVVKTMDSPGLLMKSGIDSFEEFNRKLFTCELNEEDL